MSPTTKSDGKHKGIGEDQMHAREKITGSLEVEGIEIVRINIIQCKYATDIAPHY